MRNLNLAAVAAVLLSPEPATGAAPAREPKAKPNRYDALFTGYTIKHSSASTQVYGNDGQRKSKKLADVTLTLRDGCGLIQGKIQAVQPAGKTKARAEFSFIASLRGGQALVADSDAAQRDLDNFAKTIEARFMAEYKQRQAEGVDEADETIIDGMSL